MKRINTSAISGMQELLPNIQIIFNTIKDQIARMYHLHGYQYIETPTIERTDILLAKAGGDTEKQIYKVVKTAETADEADQALRFDHTVPLARYVVEHESDLTFPFKVTQIGRNFRGERSQKGRFREFYQLDVDVIGRNSLSIAYDADVVETAYAALKTFIKPKMLIRISNRKILSGFLEALDLAEISKDIFDVIDHAEKVTVEQTKSALEELNISADKIAKILDFIKINGERETAIAALRALEIKNAQFEAGVAEIDFVLKTLEQHGLSGVAIADMLIIRGLDYYTGTVFETILPEYKGIGSICSGGRYENLASNYTDQSFPGVGISIGLTRLFYILESNQMLGEFQSTSVDYVLIPLSDAEYGFTSQVAETLRKEGKSVDILYSDKKLGDKMKYASKNAKYVGVIGENEAESRSVEFKQLISGEKETIQFA
jgi:histidine--tRNA ligase